MSRIGKNTEYKSWNSVSKEWYYPDHENAISFYGNTGDSIDWSKIISDIQDKEGCILPKLIWPNPHFEEMKKLYIDSNYILASAEWINYYPNQDYDSSLNDIFGKIVGYPRYARAWISRINPGKTAPWHWDLDDEEEKYLQGGELVRFMCKMNSDGVAQVTIVGNQAISNAKVGDIYRWNDHRAWHGSVNAGLTPKYQFNYLAYK